MRFLRGRQTTRSVEADVKFRNEGQVIPKSPNLITLMQISQD